MLKLSVNGREVILETKTFSGGEESVRILEDLTKEVTRTDNIVSITAKIKNSSDLIKLLLLNDAICRIIPKCATLCKLLELDYLPYARQDRVCNSGESFSLKVLANLINACEFDTVYIDDPHSDVATALINNCKALHQRDCVRVLCVTNDDFSRFVSSSTLVSPDAGSNKKIAEVCKMLGKGSFVRADKLRDMSTNNISETVVYADKLAGNYLIVDDICDGGRTFIALAKELKAKGADKVGLYVTHGIFSYGKKVLTEAGIDYIFAKNDWTEEE